MAHEIESMMFRGETPWHGLGTKVERAVTSEEAIKCAGLDWEVGCHQLQTAAGEKVAARATYRKTDGQIFGVVGPDYTPLQNRDAFRFFDPFLAAGEAEIETAGSLREGRRIWVLAKIKRDPLVIVKKSDDTVEKFVLLSNSHDGTTAVRVGFTPIRVVCANTLALAHGSKMSKLIRVLHFGKVTEALEDVREVMDLAEQEFTATAEQYRALAKHKIVEADLREYVRQVFPTASIPEASEEKKRSILFDSIAPLFEGGKGNALPGVKGTMWAAYNAVTEYLGYGRGPEQDKRVDSLWFGDSANTNKRALEVAVRMSQAA